MFKKYPLFIIFISAFLFSQPNNQSLMIIGVIDASTPEGGVTGKALGIKALQDIEDLSAYGYESCNNSNPCVGQEEFFPSMSLSSGQAVWFARDPDVFQLYMLTTQMIEQTDGTNQNGDDAIALWFDGVLLDRFGTDEDGTGSKIDHMQIDKQGEFINTWRHGFFNERLNEI